MPDKEFEAKIRSSLEGLDLEPSAQVWDTVSGRIRIRRRRWIFYWLPLVVLVAGMGWWRLSLQETKNDRDSIAMKKMRATPWVAASGHPGEEMGADSTAGDAGVGVDSTAGNAGGGMDSTAVDTGVGVGRVAGTLGGARSGDADGSRDGGMASVGSAAGSNRTSRRSGAPGSNRVFSRPGAPGSNRTFDMPGMAAAPSVAFAASPDVFTPQLSYSPNQPLDLFASPPAETPPGPVVHLPTTVPEQPTNAQQRAAARRTPPKEKDKWQTRVYVGTGISAQSQLLKYDTRFGSAAGVSVPYNYIPNSLSSSNPAGGGGHTYITAAREPGLGLEAGMEEEYRLARHWKVQAGLDYARWETVFGELGQANTGYSTGSGTSNNATPPTIIPGVYWGGYGVQTYTNRYSLFQLPVGVSWLIAPGKRINPTLFADVSVGYLTGNHILQYAADSIVYHTGSPDLLRHWSGYGRLGFTIDVGHWSHGLLYLGPVLEYGLSGLQKQSSVQDHLNYAGFRLGLGFR